MSNPPALSIPYKFLPLTEPARSAGLLGMMTFNPDADPIDSNGAVIAPDMLQYYGHKRYKFYIYYGGRGGGKSEQMALVAVIKRALIEKYIILCCRETFTSIKDSMYETIKQWIITLGLEGSFDFVENEIRSVSGAKFIFKGLRTNAGEIKSTKGIGLCLVDEAVNVSNDSWKFLIPTLRLDNSEFWIGFNTGTADDATYKRFVTNADERMFVCLVNIDDNPLAPQILLEERDASAALAARTGDWDEHNNVWRGAILIARNGGVFKPEMIKVLPAVPVGLRLCRGWDFASSAVTKKTPDPDWTVGLKMGITVEGMYVVVDIVRLRDTPEIVESTLINTTGLDGYDTEQSLPVDPGQAGKSQVLSFTRKLSGFRVHSSPESGDKVTRAGPFAAQVNVGNVAMVSAPWNQPFINELKSFNGDPANKDDQVDAGSRAFTQLQIPWRLQQVKVIGL